MTPRELLAEALESASQTKPFEIAGKTYARDHERCESCGRQNGPWLPMDLLMRIKAALDEPEPAVLTEWDVTWCEDWDSATTIGVGK